MIREKGAVMESLKTLLDMDFSDPTTLIPILMLSTIGLYFVAIFFDRPPQ